MKGNFDFSWKNFLLYVVFIALVCGVTGCATTKLGEDEELVKYIDYKYEVKNKKTLTEQDIREDCDMLKYLVYNQYAGIEEAIDNGFDLDATVEKIYEEAEKERMKNPLKTLDAGDFQSIVRRTFSKDLNNLDQHISIGGYLRDSISLYYSDVYFEKSGDKYFVKKVQMDSNKKLDKAAAATFEQLKVIEPGMEYKGSEANLYEMLTDDGILYRYGIMTSKKVKTIILPLNDDKYTIPASTEKTIPTKSDWTGLKSTDSTVYVSIGDCSQATGISNSLSFGDNYWNKYLAAVAEAAKGKHQIIFDLRSNPGGYMQFPARVLSALFYNQHMEEDFQNDVRALFFNKVSEDCVMLISPIGMQADKEMYSKDGHCSDEFSRLKPEIQEFYKDYWKHMKSRPVRKFIPQGRYATSLDEFPEPDFTGDIYILINEGSASAAEFGTQMAFLLEDQGINVHLVGKNTWGGMKYGGMTGWLLPNSGIYLSMGLYLGEAPTASQNPSWHGEGYGWFPDYWATNDTILNILEMLIEDPKLRETLAGLEKGQL